MPCTSEVLNASKRVERPSLQKTCSSKSCCPTCSQVTGLRRIRVHFFLFHVHGAAIVGCPENPFESILSDPTAPPPTVMFFHCPADAAILFFFFFLLLFCLFVCLFCLTCCPCSNNMSSVFLSLYLSLSLSVCVCVCVCVCVSFLSG